MKQRKKDNERGLGSADLAEMAKDDELLATEQEEKPEPPRDFDEAAVLKEVSSDHFLGRCEICRKMLTATVMGLKVNVSSTFR